MKTIALLLMIVNQVVIIIETYYDVKKQKRGVAIKHGQSAFWRACGWAIAAMAIHWQLFLLQGLYVGILAFQYWLTFDPIHNRRTGQRWCYTSGGPLDSILAGEQRRYQRLTLKLALFLSCFLPYLFL